MATLANRAIRIADDFHIQEELKFLKEVFVKNVYALGEIEKILKQQVKVKKIKRMRWRKKTSEVWL